MRGRTEIVGQGAACCPSRRRGGGVVAPDAASVWRAIEGHDRLATAFARLLLWTDPHPIPTEERAAWDCYLRLWQPGKPCPADLELLLTRWHTTSPTGRPNPERECDCGSGG